MENNKSPFGVRYSKPTRPNHFSRSFNMPNVSLTPEQQAALDKFVSDSADAALAHKDKLAADSALAAAKNAAEMATAADIADHQKALASASAFIDLMVPPTPPPPVSVSATSSKR